MGAPERADLYDAILTSTPERRRTAKPEQAAADAGRLTSRILSAWPRAPHREPSADGRTIRILKRDAYRYEQTVVDISDATYEIESVGVVVRVNVRDGWMELRADPIGREGISRLVVRRLDYHSMQTVLELRGATADPS